MYDLDLHTIWFGNIIINVALEGVGYNLPSATTTIDI